MYRKIGFFDRRHTNFSMECIEVPVDSADFGNTSNVQILRNGDLAHKMYIKTTVTNIKKIIKRLKVLIYIGEYLKYKSNNTSKIFNTFIILSNLKRFFPEKSPNITS